MQFNLRTLLIVLAVGPVVLAGGYWQATEWPAQARDARQGERARAALRMIRDTARGRLLGAVSDD